MPYASGRVIHDADAHIMEMPGFLTEHLETRYRDQITDDALFPRCSVRKPGISMMCASAS